MIYSSKLVEWGGISLLHVGAHSMPFPEEELFHSVGTVDQREITNYMAQARVFVLPSRQEGLALVLVQAALSGLPIVCSENSGGTTIKRMINDDANVHIVDRLNVACLRDTLQKALASAKKLTGTRKYADNLTQLFSAEQLCFAISSTTCRNIMSKKLLLFLFEFGFLLKFQFFGTMSVSEIFFIVGWCSFDIFS